MKKIIMSLFFSFSVFGIEQKDRIDSCSVYFNKQSHVFHSLTCDWVAACSTNCITILKTDAVKKRGRPCKVCRGGCK